MVPGDDGRRHVRRILHPIVHHRAFYDLVFNPKILDVVENLIGPNIQLHHTKLNLKPPSKRCALRVAPGLSVLPAHQLRPAGGHDHPGRLHRGERLPHDHLPAATSGAAQPPVRQRRGVLVAARGRTACSRIASRWLTCRSAGGMELHHCNMLHSSRPTVGPNAAQRDGHPVPRGGQHPAQPGPRGHYGSGLQVRGVNPGVARMVEGTFGSRAGAGLTRTRAPVAAAVSPAWVA